MTRQRNERSLGYALVASAPFRGGRGVGTWGGGYGGRGSPRHHRGRHGQHRKQPEPWCHYHNTHQHDDSECTMQHGVRQQQPYMDRGARGGWGGGRQPQSPGMRGFRTRNFGGRGQQEQRRPGGHGPPRHGAGTSSEVPPGSQLPAYPEPRRGYDYSRYPHNLPRPTGN
ncbi:unnamed protein product, partial [Pylaiella littoralis]